MSTKLPFGVAVFAFVGSVVAIGSPPKLTYKDVKPIFEAKCVPCHNDQRRFGGLNLSSYANIMKGGDDGRVIVAKNPAASKLMKMLKGIAKPRMPKGKPPLPAAEMKKISNWISQGAKS